jgi:hypothetical protein
MLADAAGSIAHRAAVDGAAHGQQFCKQISDFRKRRERAEESMQNCGVR